MLEEKKFNTGQININYVECGSGTPLLLLPGGTHTYKAFIAMIPTLATYYHVYSLDYRSHGKSDRTPGQFTPNDFADDIVSFIQNVIKGPTHIYGHSGGGMFALVVNSQIPNLVKSIIFADAPIFFDKVKDNKGFMYSWDKIMIPFAGSSHDILELVNIMGEVEFEINGNTLKYKDFSPLKERINTAYSVKLLDPQFANDFKYKFDELERGYEPEKLLGLVKCPVLIIQADPRLSNILTNEDIDKIKKHYIPHVLVYTLKGSGHLLHVLNYSEVLEVMLRFLSVLE